MKNLFGNVRLRLPAVRDILAQCGESRGLIRNFVGKTQSLPRVDMINKLLFGAKMKFL